MPTNAPALLAQELATLNLVQGLVAAALGGHNPATAAQVMAPFINLAQYGVGIYAS